MMQLSGKRGESSQKTRCGLIGSALFMARASSTCHQSSISFSSICRQRAILLSLQQREQRAQRLRAIAHQVAPPSDSGC